MKTIAQLLAENWTETIPGLFDYEAVGNEELARVILEELDQFISVNWNLEEYYLRGIVNGLKRIEKGQL